jgi:hypothetical protein
MCNFCACVALNDLDIEGHCYNNSNYSIFGYGLSREGEKNILCVVSFSGLRLQHGRAILWRGTLWNRIRDLSSDSDRPSCYPLSYSMSHICFNVSPPSQNKDFFIVETSVQNVYIFEGLLYVGTLFRGMG